MIRFLPCAGGGKSTGEPPAGRKAVWRRWVDSPGRPAAVVVLVLAAAIGAWRLGGDRGAPTPGFAPSYISGSRSPEGFPRSAPSPPARETRSWHTGPGAAVDALAALSPPKQPSRAAAGAALGAALPPLKPAPAATPSDAVAGSRILAMATTGADRSTLETERHALTSAAPPGPGPASEPSWAPALFGTRETRSAVSLTMFPRWKSMLARYDKEVATLEASCRGHASGTCRLQEWLQFLDTLRGTDRAGQVREVQRRINRERYVHDDQRLWGMSNYWETPGEFLDRGGDCKDYAVAKFMALRRLGFGNDDLRIFVVRDTRRRLDHAVLVVYLDGRALVLDNQQRDVVPASAVRHYRPYYSINETAWWAHLPATAEPRPAAPAESTIALTDPLDTGRGSNRTR